jgi:hypothetical protein
MIGDDLVITDQSLAQKYKEIITELGVEFSKPKSYESPHFFEFAKRII